MYSYRAQNEEINQNHLFYRNTQIQFIETDVKYGVFMYNTTKFICKIDREILVSQIC
jgi:hypothetical protein